MCRAYAVPLIRGVDDRLAERCSEYAILLVARIEDSSHESRDCYN